MWLPASHWATEAQNTEPGTENLEPGAQNLKPGAQNSEPGTQMGDRVCKMNSTSCTWYVLYEDLYYILHILNVSKKRHGSPNRHPGGQTGSTFQLEYNVTWSPGGTLHYFVTSPLS